MPTIQTEHLFSGAERGEPIAITATSSPGTLIHRNSDRINTLHNVAIYAAIVSGTTDVKVTFEYGHPTDGYIKTCSEVTLKANNPPAYLHPNLPVKQWQEIRAYVDAGNTNRVNAIGLVYRRVDGFLAGKIKTGYCGGAAQSGTCDIAGTGKMLEVETFTAFYDHKIKIEIHPDFVDTISNPTIKLYDFDRDPEKNPANDPLVGRAKVTDITLNGTSGGSIGYGFWQPTQQRYRLMVFAQNAAKMDFLDAVCIDWDEREQKIILRGFGTGGVTP